MAPDSYMFFIMLYNNQLSFIDIKMARLTPMQNPNINHVMKINKKPGLPIV